MLPLVNIEKMTAEQILDVINKLVGEIEPSGSQHLDDKRTDNLKTYLEIWYEMYTRIDAIVDDNSWHHQHSIKNMVDLCEEQLRRVVILNR